ncbi:uncharacterized protein LOC143735213 isoform X2 [Siphateles boraxobius]|uniref:uncharacterized protein LOC143735213 isoform X2 n=1 Tax=Siphateles boraxobius TaxID=180520 RepID=UPI0040641D0B
MKLFLNSIAVILILLDNGVFGVESDKVSVMEGDSVTLYTGVKTNQQEDIKWYFNDIRIADINGDLNKTCTDVQCNEGNERFRNRLKLDHQTGSLTIRNINTIDSGVYELKIISSRISGKIFNVSVHGVSAAERDKVKRKSVKEGESVTLYHVVIRKPSDVMLWYFNDIHIADTSGDQNKTCTDVQCKERFRDRLKLDHQTGSLTITNTRNTDSGEYKLQIIINNNSSFSITRVKRFNLTVIGSGLSSGAVAGICVGVLLVSAVVTAGVIYYRPYKSHGPVPQDAVMLITHHLIPMAFLWRTWTIQVMLITHHLIRMTFLWRAWNIQVMLITHHLIPMAFLWRTWTIQVMLITHHLIPMTFLWRA